MEVEKYLCFYFYSAVISLLVVHDSYQMELLQSLCLIAALQVVFLLPVVCCSEMCSVFRLRQVFIMYYLWIVACLSLRYCHKIMYLCILWNVFHNFLQTLFQVLVPSLAHVLWQGLQTFTLLSQHLKNIHSEYVMSQQSRNMI